MTETHFNLIFNGKLEAGHKQDEVRRTLESLFKFDDENQSDFFSGQPVILSENMNATTANSFKQALADAGVATQLVTANDIVADQDVKSRRRESRRNNTVRRARIRSAAILPDRRQGMDRRR